MAPSKSPTVSDKDVVALIKKGVSINDAAAQLKTTPSAMAGMYFKLESVADPSLKIVGTPKQVAKGIVEGRNEGVRWEKLAARSDKSVKEVKEIFEGATGIPAIESYSGKGRRFDGSAPAKKAPAAKKTPVGRKPATKATPKARTRAERAKKTGNPS